MKQLTLYHFEGCPYCARVKDYLKQANIAIAMKDIHADSLAREELLKIGGRTQVPCLAIDGKTLYESMDIIKWLKENYAKK